MKTAKCADEVIEQRYCLLQRMSPEMAYENAKTLNRDRTSYSFAIVLGAQIASPFNFENELKNIILVALRVFEFSHMG